MLGRNYTSVLLKCSRTHRRCSSFSFKGRCDGRPASCAKLNWASLIRTLTWPVTSQPADVLFTCWWRFYGRWFSWMYFQSLRFESDRDQWADLIRTVWIRTVSVWFGPCGCRVLSLVVLRVSTTSIKTEQLCECLCVDTSMEPIDPSLWLIRTESPSVTRCAACLMFCSDTDPVSSQVSMMSSPLCAGHRWCLRWTSTVLTSGVRTEPELFNFKHQQHV